MLKTKEEIKEWLDGMEIENYNINDDLTVDVNGNVYLNNEDMYEIPFQFGTVDGNFSCASSNLKSLKGSPIKVKGYFNCGNNLLKTLEYCPREIDGGLFIGGNEIESFEGAPSRIGSGISCDSTVIKNLDGLRNTKIAGSLVHKVNSIGSCIFSFEHLYLKVKGIYDYELVLPSEQIEAFLLHDKLTLELENDKASSKKLKL